MGTKKAILFNKLSFWTLISTVFLSIFFFLPYLPVSLDASKGFLLSIGVVASFFLWLVARLVDGEFTIPKDRLVFFGFLIPITFLISAFFSTSKKVSFFGQGFELGTVGSMIVLFLGFFLCSVYFQSEEKIKYFFKAIFLGASILLGFEIIHVIFNAYNLLPDMFQGVSFGNLYGGWNNFAIFFGATIIISLVTLELSEISKARRIWLSILVVLGLFMLSLVNSSFVWLLTAIFSVIIFVYSVSSQQFLVKTGKIKEKDLPILSFITILVSLLFLFSTNSLGRMIPEFFGVTNNIVRPSLSGTFEIIKHSLSYNPVFGTGPNTFSIDWAMWRPEGVVLSQFWNYSFPTGVSFFVSNLATVGVVGFLAFLLFIVVFLLRGVQSMFIAIKNTQANYFIFGSFILAFYFWIISIFMIPSMTSIMIAFVSSGVFLGSLVYKKILPIQSVSFLKDPRASFFAILGLVVALVLSVAVVYVYISRFIGTIYVSTTSVNTSDLASLDHAERNLSRATTLNKDAGYYRVLSQVYISKFNIIANDKSLSEDTAKVAFQRLINQAETSALSATKLNQKDYTNWVNLGDVYTFFASIGVEGAYNNALNSYDKAIELSSKSPAVLLSKAQLEVYNKNTQEARNLINQALEIKPNYTDAMFAMARLDTNEGRLSDAIKQAERAASISQNDPSVFFNLGILRYNAKDYSGAVSAFETSVRLSPNYMNARYFLGISYQKVGRIDEAKAQLALLNQVFPDNADVKKALDAIETGQSIVEEQTEEENITDLPIEEEEKQ